jgi:hypothetical protein
MSYEYKSQILNLKLQTTPKLQFEMIKIFFISGTWFIGIYSEFALPARSPTSRSLAEGRRSGEGRSLRFGASLAIPDQYL